MKKNRTMKLACVLLALAIMTSCFVGGTFAKYTSTSTAEDSARVAKWSFTVGTTDVAQSSDFIFDLFATIVDTVDGNTDTELTDTAKVIAPGTKGTCSVVLTNASEVDAEYVVDFSGTDEAGVPLEWSLTGEDGTWINNITDLDVKANIEIGKTATITLYWRWVFEGNHTSLGTAKELAEPSVSVKVTVTQLD